MARGWMADSAGTKVKFEGSPVDNRTNQIMKVSLYTDLYSLKCHGLFLDKSFDLENPR